MYNVIQSPEFLDNVDPNDPISKLDMRAQLDMAGALAFQIDAFVRRVLKKVINDDLLQLYVDTKAPIPELDMELYLTKPHERTITVKYRDVVIGKATFITTCQVQPDGAVHVKHEARDILI